MNFRLIIHPNLQKLTRPVKNKVACLTCVQSYSTASEEIVIPRKIPRGPTDILRALESTLGKDLTAAHYKYHDDPYLIPKSNLGKRSLALAHEAGRKAAHWVRRENTDLFQHKEADPFIDPFAPPKIYTESTEVTLDDLESCIKHINVTDAINVYKLLKSQSIEIPTSTMQSLLELLCFYNGEDTLPEEFIEERWFRQSAKGNERQRKTWKDGSFAEEIFISITEPSGETYSAIIQGMVKYYQVERAAQLFEEAKQKGLNLSVSTYNSMIEAGNFLKENFDMRWAYIVELLKEMNSKKMRPNLGTLNAVLYCLSMMGSKFTKDTALKTLTEFKKLNIEPSLATWHFTLQIFCKERGPTSTVLIDILNYLESKEHTIRDIRDVNFFLTAMAISRYHLNDFHVAKRVHTLLNYGKNYDLIGDSFRESVYYRHYFILAVNSEPINDFMELYEKFVPHIYTPELVVFDEILKQIEVSGAVEYMPKIWSEMVIFECASKEDMLNFILQMLVTNEPKENPELSEKFANVGKDIFEKVMGEDNERTRKITVTGEMLGNILVLYLRNQQFQEAWNVFVTLDKQHQKVIGVPSFQALSLLLDACIEEKVPSKGIMCLQYGVDAGYENMEELARKLQEKLTLDVGYIQSISKIVGQHAILEKN